MSGLVSVLEAHVPPERHGDLRAAYRAAAHEIFPPGLIRSVLLQGASDPNLWRIQTMWESREHLEAMRTQGTPRGVLMFRAAGAEPTVMLFQVADELKPSAVAD